MRFGWYFGRYTPAWAPAVVEAEQELDLDDLLQQMKFALEMADRNARLIHPIPWQEAQVLIQSQRLLTGDSLLTLPASSAPRFFKMLLSSPDQATKPQANQLKEGREYN